MGEVLVFGKLRPTRSYPKVCLSRTFVNHFVIGSVTCLIRHVKASICSRCRMKINLITKVSISNVPVPVEILWQYYNSLSEEVSDIKDFLIVREAYGKALNCKGLILI